MIMVKNGRIGNKPPAHYAAKDVFDKKLKPNYTLTLEEILKATKKADGHLRECLSTLVDAQSQLNKKIISDKFKKSRHG
mgnify:FL=1